MPIKPFMISILVASTVTLGTAGLTIATAHSQHALSRTSPTTQAFASDSDTDSDTSDSDPSSTTLSSSSENNATPQTINGDTPSTSSPSQILPEPSQQQPLPSSDPTDHAHLITPPRWPGNRWESWIPYILEPGIVLPPTDSNNSWADIPFEPSLNQESPNEDDGYAYVSNENGWV